MPREGVFVSDTHALAWFLTRDRQLSETARAILLRAEAGAALVYVPTIVLSEFLYLAMRGKVPLDRLFELLVWMEERPGFRDLALDVTTIHQMIEARYLHGVDLEMHDLSILASALVVDARLITKDRKLRSQALVATVW